MEQGGCFYFSDDDGDYSYYSSYPTYCDVVKFMVRMKNEGKEGECKEQEPFTLKK